MARISLLLLLAALGCLLSACSGSRIDQDPAAQALVPANQQQGISLPQFPVELPDTPRESFAGLNVSKDGGR